MTPQRHLSLVITLVFTLGLFYGSSSGQETSLDPHMPNVCAYQTYVKSEKLKNITYDCYRLEEFPEPCPTDYWPAPSGDHHYHRHRRYWRWKRQVTSGMCIRTVTDRCTTTLRLLVEIVVTKYYCCNGTQPDGLGGCAAEAACSRRNGGCEQRCVVDGTAHKCACLPGYKLLNATHCTDINECAADNGGCNQICKNTPGNYYCSCQPGYELQTEHTCTKHNPCLVGNGGCEHNCTETADSYFCSCDVGFQLSGGKKCLDEDECSDPIVSNGGCSHTCMNVFGDYYCACPDGFVLKEDAFNCQPIWDADGYAEPATSSEMLSRPVIWVPILCGIIIIIIIIIITICCIRKPRRVPPPEPQIIATPHIFILGKGKKEVVIEAVEASDHKLDLETGNYYTDTPQRKESFSQPPTYDDVVFNSPKQESSRDLPPRYEKPILTEKSLPVYANLAYIKNETTPPLTTATINDATPSELTGDVNENTKIELTETKPNPYATVMRKFRKTGKLDALACP